MGGNHKCECDLSPESCNEKGNQGESSEYRENR